MRYTVNAAVTSDAWTTIEADDLEDAREQASTLEPSDLELGDPIYVGIESVVLDD
jgi:hypothetical protein